MSPKAIIAATIMAFVLAWLVKAYLERPR